ncbi:MAG: PEP-CTERM sorting domain-containing protein [Gemmataceae bacterium]|nr:PEP-CTERM sorting domain-containing protein [Gemmataceae bacterium]
MLRPLSFRTAALLVAIEMAFVSETRADFIQWKQSDGGNDHYYGLVLPTSPAGNYNWFAARDAAANTIHLGSTGHLVTITSAPEDNFLKSTFESMIGRDVLSPRVFGDYAWLGLTDQIAEGQFQWITGESFGYSNWSPFEPNNLGNEDFVWLWRRDFGSGPLWSWNDAGAFPSTNIPGARIGYIVEFDGPFQAVPEPSSFALFAVGTIGLLALMRRERYR